MSDKLFLQALDIVFDDFNVDCSAGSLSIETRTMHSSKVK